MLLREIIGSCGACVHFDAPEDDPICIECSAKFNFEINTTGNWRPSVQLIEECEKVVKWGDVNG